MTEKEYKETKKIITSKVIRHNSKPQNPETDAKFAVDVTCALAKLEWLYLQSRISQGNLIIENEFYNDLSKL